MIQLLMLFLTLLFWHALADSLQGPLSTAKRRGGTPGFPWQLALFTHAYIHAFGVVLITSNLWGGLIELVAHTGIDYAKCEGKFGPAGFAGNNKAMWTDQFLHVLTKVVIIVVLRVRFA